MDADWRIRLVRSGGITGLVTPVELGPGDLTEDELRELDALLDTLEQRPAAREPLGPADRFQYDLTLERGTQRRHVTVGEGQLDREQRAVFKRLLQRRAS